MVKVTIKKLRGITVLKKSRFINFCLCFLLILATVSSAVPASAISKQSIGLAQTGTDEVTVICEPASGATHYEVVYSNSKTMDTYKRATFTTNACKIESLATSSYYYFKARSYKLVNGTKTYLTSYSSVKGIYVQPSYVETSAQIEYTFKNLPNARVPQAFYIDTVEKCVYTTQVAPVNDENGQLVREDTILAKCRINDHNEAVCESYLYILNGGHGVILQGYRDDNNELRFYIGCVYKADVGYCTGVANIAYDEAYANKYDPEIQKFRNADGEVTSCPGTRIDGVDYKTTVLNSGENLENYKKGRLLNIQKLLATGEEFVKFDFVRSELEDHFVVIKYKKSGMYYTRVLRIDADLDSVTTTQKKATNFSAYAVTQFHDRKVERTLISGGWQSTGVYGSSAKPHIMINGNVGYHGIDYQLRFIDVRSNRVYNVAADTSGYVDEEEIEGLQIIDGRVYFVHKATGDADNKKLFTIQSFPLV